MAQTTNSPESLAEARFTALLDAAVDAILVIDGKGLIETFNKAAETMFGYPAKAVFGRNVSMLMPNPYSAEHDQYINRYLDTGEKRIIGIGREVSGRRATGEVFPLDLSVGAIDHGGEQKFVGIIRDITDRKQTQKLLREQQERLEHVMRLGTLGEMAAGIAHEINQPLTAIATYAQAARRLITSGRMEDDRLLDVLDKTGKQAERAGEIIRRIRTLARKQPAKRARHELNAVVLEALRLAEVDTRLHDVALEYKTADQLPQASVDSVQIQQVILNLIRNAIETKPPAQRIVVSTFSRADAEVVVEVADDGPGVDEELLSEIFNPFFTTKENGTGIGLSISRSIVATHGGRLEARNNAVSGATFSVVLPTVFKSESESGE